MNGNDIFKGLKYVGDDLVEEAEFGQFRGKKVNEKKVGVRRLSRPLLIAAILAGILMLAGCGTVVYKLVTAQCPLFDLPLLHGEDIDYESIRLTATGISPTGLHLYCDIDDDAFPEERVADSENAIYMLSIAPYKLDRKTESGWEALPKKIEDAQWTADKVLTDGHYDWNVSWGGVYGILEPGIYRLTTTVIEGQPDVSIEFTIEEAENLTTAQALDKCNQAIQTLIDQEYYHVMMSSTKELGDMSNLPDGVYIGEDSSSYEEKWKLGEDYLSLLMWEPGVVDDGMMKKGGVKYRLDHENEGDSHTPIAGWSVWPDLDDERLAGWANGFVHSPDSVIFPEGIAVISDKEITFQVLGSEVRAGGVKAEIPATISYFFDADGKLTGIETKIVNDQVNGFDVEATYTNKLEVFDTDKESIEAKFAQQNVNFYREFSWENDRQTLPALDIPLQNTTESPILTAPDAIARAENECRVEYTKVVVYRDQKAGMWKVEYQILYGHQGYQYIYLNDKGITQMISGSGSKVEEWKKFFPDPQ